MRSSRRGYGPRSRLRPLAATLAAFAAFSSDAVADCFLCDDTVSLNETLASCYLERHDDVIARLDAGEPDVEVDLSECAPSNTKRGVQGMTNLGGEAKSSTSEPERVEEGATAGVDPEYLGIEGMSGPQNVLDGLFDDPGLSRVIFLDRARARCLASQLGAAERPVDPARVFDVVAGCDS